MNEIAQHLDILVVVIGAALGSFKASQEFDKDKPFCNRSIDVAIGIFVGLSMAFHFGAQFSLWLSGLLAVVGGASGVMVLEVLMQMLPSVTRKMVKKWLGEKSK
jgi:hypothetical protein